VGRLPSRWDTLGLLAKSLEAGRSIDAAVHRHREALSALRHKREFPLNQLLAPISSEHPFWYAAAFPTQASSDPIPPEHNVAVVAAIIRYLRLSGWTPQSVDRVAPELPRWALRLRARGITTIPSLPVGGGLQSALEAQAHNELNLLMLQTSKRLGRDTASTDLAHHLRNRTGIRPYKS